MLLLLLHPLNTKLTLTFWQLLVERMLSLLFWLPSICFSKREIVCCLFVNWNAGRAGRLESCFLRLFLFRTSCDCSQSRRADRSVTAPELASDGCHLGHCSVRQVLMCCPLCGNVSFSAWPGQAHLDFDSDSCSDSAAEFEIVNQPIACWHPFKFKFYHFPNSI